MGIKGADLEDEFLLQILAALRHVLFGVVREIKVTSNWLRCILVLLINIAKVFEESVA